MEEQTAVNEPDECKAEVPDKAQEPDPLAGRADPFEIMNRPQYKSRFYENKIQGVGCDQSEISSVYESQMNSNSPISKNRNKSPMKSQFSKRQVTNFNEEFKEVKSAEIKQRRSESNDSL